MAPRIVSVILFGSLLAAPVLTAQDTLPDPTRAERLREVIEDRFADRLTRELGLTDEETVRVEGILRTWAARRRTLESEERRLRRQLQAEMRPGVAANEAEVTRALDAILDGRIAYVQTFKEELEALSAVLTPVQRAQYLVLRDRLAQRVQEIRERREAARPGGGPRRR